jgi:hypothetical protein
MQSENWRERDMVTRIDPPLPMETPKGKAMAHFLIDYGPEHHLLWVCFQDETGECWTWNNPDVRLQANLSMGRKPPEKKSP